MYDSYYTFGQISSLIHRSMEIGKAYNCQTQFVEGRFSPNTLPINCKNCGAPLKGNCEYCGTSYIDAWLRTDLDAMANAYSFANPREVI